MSFGDSLYFVGIASAFTSMTFCDIRKSGLPFRDIEEDRADLTNLPPSWTGTLQSISCMHVLEHIGLGRYGDTLDASGDRKAAGGTGTRTGTGRATPNGRPDGRTTARLL